MAEFRSYRFPIEDAKYLASLEGMRHDIQATLEYCDRLDSMRGEPFDIILWEAVSAAAVVRYSRCFTSGVRIGLTHDLLDVAPEDVQRTHEYIVAVRSKHVAHSVNEFEENDVTVTLREDEGLLQITGIGAHQGRVAGLPLDGPNRLRGLCKWVLAWIHTEVTSERERLLEVAKQYDPAEIKAFGIASAGKGASEEGAKRSRKRP
jgi:hypothetical protein